MKILKTESPYLTKSQWKKLFLAMSILTIALYIGAMIASLFGSKYFILNYQNEQKRKVCAQFENFVNCYLKNKDTCYFEKQQKKIKKLTDKLRKALL